MADVPLAVVTGTIWAYWFCVGAMIIRVRRKARHGVGVVPEQPIERALWLVLVPTLVAWAVLPYLALHRAGGVLAVPDFARQPPYSVLRWIAAAVGLACLAASIKSWRRMGKDWRMDVSERDRGALITDGLFRYVRHPIYAFQVLLMLCTAIIAPNAPVLLVAALHLAIMNFKAHNEERHLLRTHGDDYARYIERTGRFFPRLGRRP
jgi:protein-S-isoprenylcysteine O-methyltransferase Ste14